MPQLERHCNWQTKESTIFSTLLIPFSFPCSELTTTNQIAKCAHYRTTQLFLTDKYCTGLTQKKPNYVRLYIGSIIINVPLYRLVQPLVHSSKQNVPLKIFLRSAMVVIWIQGYCAKLLCANLCHHFYSLRLSEKKKKPKSKVHVFYR